MQVSNIEISTDKERLDIPYIHAFLTNSYWAKGISVDLVRSSIEHSFCFGLYQDGSQIGFARVITDFTIFAYLADVFIDEKERGRGLGVKLVETIMSHQNLQGLRRWHLLTSDAQGLYRRFGFETPVAPDTHMEKKVNAEQLYG